MTGLLPYGRQTIDDDDVAAVAAALRGDFLTTGPLVGAFERAFAERVGAAHAVACANGTAALHLTMLAQGSAKATSASSPRSPSSPPPTAPATSAPRWCSPTSIRPAA